MSSEEAHNRLLAAVEALSTSDDWLACLASAGRFHTYSIGNVMLIAFQRPDATRVAGFKAWQGMGRQVRKGEKGIAILAPMISKRETDDERPTCYGFRTAWVFDIAQTDGEPLPEVPCHRLEGLAPEGLVSSLEALVREQGFSLTYGDPGVSGANGVTLRSTRAVVIRDAMATAQTAKTLAHELAHVLLHSDGCQRDRSVEETEAESVAWMVCDAVGLETGAYSIGYVTSWSAGDVDLVRKTADRVCVTARQVIDRLACSPATCSVATAERAA